MQLTPPFNVLELIDSQRNYMLRTKGRDLVVVLLSPRAYELLRKEIISRSMFREGLSVQDVDNKIVLGLPIEILLVDLSIIKVKCY